jgi:hypothetical protein
MGLQTREEYIDCEADSTKKSLFPVQAYSKKFDGERGRWTDEEHKIFIEVILETRTLNWKMVLINF